MPSKNTKKRLKKLYGESLFNKDINRYMTSLVQESCLDDIKEIQRLIDNPPTDFAIKHYGSVEAYIKMLKKKLKKYQKEFEEECDENPANRE